MRKPFLITLIITFIGAVSWGMYASKTNPLDYLFEIGVVLMGLGISILWQMKLFFLKPEHKKSFSSWRKKPDKKFVTLFMRDEQRMLPFIAPLVYLARALSALGISLFLVGYSSRPVELLEKSGENLIFIGLAFSFGWFCASYVHGLRGHSKERKKKIMSLIKIWQENPDFIPVQGDHKMYGIAGDYIFDQMHNAFIKAGFVVFLIGIIAR